MKINKEVFSKNLQRYMNIRQKQQSDIVRDLGVNKGSLSLWYNGVRYPRKDEVVFRLADYLGCTVGDLVNESSDKRKGVRIPVYGSVAAGIPLEMIDDIIDWEEIDEHTASKGTCFGLKVKGNSMEPRILNGDIVIVKQQDDIETGDVAIVSVSGNEATCKRVRKLKDGIELVPINPSYEPKFYSNEEVESMPVTIIGKVIELRGKV